jgi:hypothetical protein
MNCFTGAGEVRFGEAPKPARGARALPTARSFACPLLTFHLIQRTRGERDGIAGDQGSLARVSAASPPRRDATPMLARSSAMRATCIVMRAA